MYRHERSTTPDRPQSSHIAAKTAEKNVAAPISNQFALSRSITQMQSLGSAPDELHGKLTNRISSRRNNGLPLQLQNGIENLSGYSMDGVRVHYNSPRPAQLQALAYAKGEDIYVAPGQEKHLPHEAWHIVQQKQGRAVPTGRVNGVNINDNPVLEHEADVMGAKAVQFRSDVGNDSIRLEKAQESAAQMQHEPSELNHKNYSSDRKDSVSDPPYDDAFSKIKTIIEDAKLTDDNEAFALTTQKIPKQEYTNIWDDIKNDFSTAKNINMIIYKLFRGNDYGDGNEELNFSIAVDNLDRNYVEMNKEPALWEMFLNDLKVPISETLNDIFYWNCTRMRQPPQSLLGKAAAYITGRSVCKEIIDIVLTDSDIHERGIGVCIITFDDKEKLVIKPEQKNFEKIVYGKKDNDGQNSLAADFNSIIKPNVGQLDLNDYDNAGVGELMIETSPQHGSAIEYFPHKKFTKMGKEEQLSIKKAALVNTIIFSSILGLADLHYENMVYGDGKVQLIDAEVGLKYLLDRLNPLSTAKKEGEMIIESGTSIPENFDYDFTKYHDITFLQKLINFLKGEVKSKLQNQRVRIVIFKTSDLYTWRDDVYSKKMQTKTIYLIFLFTTTNYRNIF